MHYFLLGFISGGVGFFVGVFVGISDGRDLGYKQGAIAHASGQITCQLVEQPDKTTKWECE